MALNTPVFLFLFLPLFLLSYFLAGHRYRNFVLLAFSLGFFAWSDPFYFPFMLVLCMVNFLLVRWMQKKPAANRNKSQILVLGTTINIVSLLTLKLLSAYGEIWLVYLSDRAVNIPAWLIFLLSFSFHQPLGLSFFAFQAISMLADGIRSDDLGNVGLGDVINYLLMFPKVIAGPILRFRHAIRVIQKRESDWNSIEIGARRFIVGFAKKTLIADQLALITDRGIFNVAPSHIPIGIAWLVVISFTLQIYYDFSGYTDMAIGLGRMLGFHFPENFNFPYSSFSITDFWRRWHITLSNWFRDYVFYPLERKRREIPLLTQSLDIILVFLLTGLWHGITPPFIVWGLMHGLTLVIERGRFGNWLARIWRPFQHAYALTIIILGWIFFRSPTLGYAWNLLKVLLGILPSNRQIPFSDFQPVSSLTWISFIAGIIFSVPLPASLQMRIDEASSKQRMALTWVRNLVLILLFIAGIAVQAGTNYSPFIYGEF